MIKNILSEIYEKKIVAIIRGIDSDRILDTVGALITGGVNLLEVTFEQQDDSNISNTINCIKLINSRYGDRVCLGAGTVMSTNQVEEAADAGAQYIISPNTNKDVIQRTKELGLVSIPGGFTPSEIAYAWQLGADVVKLFPAGINGVEYIKAILNPMKHIPLMAVGGIGLDNLNCFIRAGVKGVGVGGNLVDKKAIYSGEFYRIAETARAYVNKIKEL